MTRNFDLTVPVMVQLPRSAVELCFPALLFKQLLETESRHEPRVNPQVESLTLDNRRGFFSIPAITARALRIECDGALHHVTEEEIFSGIGVFAMKPGFRSAPPCPMVRKRTLRTFVSFVPPLKLSHVGICRMDSRRNCNVRHTRPSALLRINSSGYPGLCERTKNLDSRLRGNDDQEK
jgi:hypothetical protein